jgi:hypothetical protein
VFEKTKEIIMDLTTIKSYKYTALAFVLVGIISFGSGRYLTPTKVVTQIKTVEVEHVIKDDNVVTTTHEVKEPDGEDVVDTTTKDLTTTVTQEKEATEETKTVTTEKPQWKVSGIITAKPLTLYQPSYGALVERRILGPVFIGAGANTDSTLYLSIGVEF